MDYLRYFLEPKAVAIIGATATPNKIGYMIIENSIIWGGFDGKIYPVNPHW
jgi:acyl-CoA synthetase (NDP forming)